MPAYFRPHDTLRVHRGNLPHWRQSGVAYFVTTRLADSMPQEKLHEWQTQRDAWLATHGIQEKDLDSVPEELRHKFHNTFTRQWHDWLDSGMGECLLRRPAIRAALVRRFTDDSAFDAWVIMPNHFHALVTPGDRTLGKILQKCKGASAREIHAMLGLGGTLWQKEPFDHIVRSEAQLRHYRRYIAENPVKAGLPSGDYAVGFGDQVFDDAEAMLDHLGKAEA